MIKDSIQRAIDDQIKQELYSAYFYLSAAGYFEAAGLSGFARWMRVQSREEVGHAMKFFDFVYDRSSHVTLQAIDQPPSDFQSPLDVFTRALQNEQHVTSLIHQLYALALQEHDYPTQVLLQWFITEQVEEERSASTIVGELTMAGDNASALLLLNNELGKRRAEDS